MSLILFRPFFEMSFFLHCFPLWCTICTRCMFCALLRNRSVLPYIQGFIHKIVPVTFNVCAIIKVREERRMRWSTPGAMTQAGGAVATMQIKGEIKQ